MPKYILVIRDDYYFLVGPVTEDEIKQWGDWNMDEGGDDPRWQTISLKKTQA